MGTGPVYPENGPWAELHMDWPPGTPDKIDWVNDEVYENEIPCGNEFRVPIR